MEALTAVSVACLTIYDMVKAVERGMRIEGIRVLRKSGGKSGDTIGRVSVALMPVAEALARALAGAPTVAGRACGAHGGARPRARRTSWRCARSRRPMSGHGRLCRAGCRCRPGAGQRRARRRGGAGHPFEGTVGSREAARIFTGGVLPAGADAS
jgi:hypothetical protein